MIVDEQPIHEAATVDPEEIGALRSLARAIIGQAVADTIAKEPRDDRAARFAHLMALDPQDARDWLLDPDEDDEAWLLILCQAADVDLGGIQHVIESGDRDLIRRLAGRLYRGPS